MLRSSAAQNTVRPRFSLISLLAFAVLAFIAYYLFGGFEHAMEKVNSAEANRAAAQPIDNPAGLSKSEYERQRANQYGNAVQNSNSLSVVRNHNEEVRQMMQAGQGNEQQH
jgi:hypothetical protein